MKKKKFSTTNILVLMIVSLAVFLPAVSADLVLDNLQFDPAIISSGDEVDVVIQFHESGATVQQNKLANPDYTFGVKLLADDSISKEYILIQDSEGTDLHGSIISGDSYLKKFRLKVAQDAPAGNYGLRMEGRWYYKGVAESAVEYKTFMMNVKRVGVSLTVSNIISDPERIRAGDKNILLKTEITNSGEKAAKNIQVKLDYPAGISSSYTNNNQLTLGVIDSMQKQDLQFFIDTDKAMKDGVYHVNYTISYQDIDNNNYMISHSFPIVIKKKPRIIVTDYSGEGLAGESGEIKVTLRNVGEEKADSVDIRIIKQSSQPFELDVRSEYLGQMKSGETATAIFKLNILSDAEVKTHKLNVMIRAKGDSEEGDDGIYTFSDSIAMNVTGVKGNPYPMYAGIFVAAVIVLMILFYALKRKRK